MGTNTFANNNEISSKGASGKSIACFPDPCYTPPPTPAGVEAVIPYPNTGQASDLDKGSTKVLICNKMVALEDTSYFSKSMGDEPAKPSSMKGGVMSHTVQGKLFYTQWSQDVKFEGKGVARHIDLMTHNHASQAGNTPPHPYTDSMTPPQSCDNDKNIEENCGSDANTKTQNPEQISAATKSISSQNYKNYIQKNGLPNWMLKSCSQLMTPPKTAEEAQQAAEKTESDACMRARRCKFVPYKNTVGEKKFSGEGCCPGHSGHHVIPGCMAREGCGSYSHRDAPVVCVEGKNNSHGTHGKIHRNMFRALADKPNPLSKDEAFDAAAESLHRLFPGCHPACTIKQLEKQYAECTKDFPKKSGLPDGQKLDDIKGFETVF